MNRGLWINQTSEMYSSTNIGEFCQIWHLFAIIHGYARERSCNIQHKLCFSFSQSSAYGAVSMVISFGNIKWLRFIDWLILFDISTLYTISTVLYYLIISHIIFKINDKIRHIKETKIYWVVKKYLIANINIIF